MAKSVKDQTIASERFLPSLNEEYTNRYNALIEKLSKSLPINREDIIKQEISALNNSEELSLEALKYSASLHVLVDLSQQGWVFDVDNGELTLRMENENVDDKDMLRYRLSAERNAQFKTESVAYFVRLMEKEKNYKGKKISIRNLFGNPQLLQNAINNGDKICTPYIQLATNTKDKYTGYYLKDIWRYFRYTWSIPYKTMPGRNLYYLVRDSSQPYHPIIGIFALGNSVLNLTVRDNEIGWTVEAIKANMNRRYKEEYCDQAIREAPGKTIKVKVVHPLETNEEYLIRVQKYADEIFPLLQENIRNAIGDIYVKDFDFHKQTRYPKPELISALEAIAAEYAEKSINNKNNEVSPNWEEEAKSNLFKRKRATELAKLLETTIAFNEAEGSTNFEKLSNLLSNEAGRKAINTALVANRKCKIGSNMMDIIVCGSIPPYNELLGGKLVSILACSPMVIRDYTKRYNKQVSEIASRMKGEKVIRDSRLAYLGTTSLYAIGSSQYNRIKVPLDNGSFLEFKKMGITEGYGTVFFSKETVNLFSKILEIQDGGRRINNVFGEGTSPRFRMISKGLVALGIRADAFLRHYSPRIVYSINLAKNTNEFLLGLDKDVEYNFDIDSVEETREKTEQLIDYWYHRWLIKRTTTVDINERLSSFNVEDYLIGNI